MKFYINVLQNYFKFSGRASRQEYWMFVLFNFLFSIGALIIDGIMGTAFFNVLYTLVLLAPSVAVAIRRLHDTDRSGWWYLIGLVPLVGWLVLLVFLTSKGTEGENTYGAESVVE
jgi:uncharacterized membrane protein YhaH (DUF805 family)